MALDDEKHGSTPDAAPMDGGTSSAKDRVLKVAISKLEKQFGKGFCVRMNEVPGFAGAVVPSGSLVIDNLSGIGGLPEGRIIEIFGPESAAKTTFCLAAIAEVQRRGETAALVDAEHAYDPAWGRVLGVKDDLLVSQPGDAEQAFTAIETLVSTGLVKLVVVDSVAALVPREELEGEFGDLQLGLQARLMGQAMRKLCGLIQEKRAIVIFINQVRDKIGAPGNPEVTTGGNALKFYASLRIRVSKGDVLLGENVADAEQPDLASNTKYNKQIKPSKTPIGQVINIKIVKNKCASPYKCGAVDLIYGVGFIRELQLARLAVRAGVVQKSGNWFSYQGKKLGQGREAIVEALKENPAISAEIETKLRTLWSEGLGQAKAGAAEPEESGE